MREARIRGAQAEDVDEIVRLAALCPTAPHWRRSQYEAMLSDGTPPRRLLVAEVDGRMAGFAAGALAGGNLAGGDLASGHTISVGVVQLEGELETVVVVPQIEGQGIGGELVRAVLAWMRAAGAAGCLLEVRSSSAGAVHLYEKLGFRRAGLRRGYYADPADDALVMQLVFDRRSHPAGDGETDV